MRIPPKIVRWFDHRWAPKTCGDSDEKPRRIRTTSLFNLLWLWEAWRALSSGGFNYSMISINISSFGGKTCASGWFMAALLGQLDAVMQMRRSLSYRDSQVMKNYSARAVKSSAPGSPSIFDRFLMLRASNYEMFRWPSIARLIMRQRGTQDVSICLEIISLPSDRRTPGDSIEFQLNFLPQAVRWLCILSVEETSSSRQLRRSHPVLDGRAPFRFRGRENFDCHRHKSGFRSNTFAAAATFLSLGINERKPLQRMCRNSSKGQTGSQIFTRALRGDTLRGKLSCFDRGRNLSRIAVGLSNRQHSHDAFKCSRRV